VKKRLDKAPFGEPAKKLAIQQSISHDFSGKVPSGNGPVASYRKVGAYTKSLTQYKHERLRRWRVRLLTEQGFTQEQIAKQLGVSTRTVKRDWQKVKPYVLSQFNLLMKERLQKERQETEAKYAGLTLKEAIRLLRRDLQQVLLCNGINCLMWME
jgi:DNA-binding CsgD family transcriptional regulator